VVSANSSNGWTRPINAENILELDADIKAPKEKDLLWLSNQKAVQIE
jgi:hypothetical protein